MSGINRVAFTVFGFPVYWYGALIALGMLLGVCVAGMREKRYNQKKDTVLNFILIAIPMALICARIYYVVFSWSDYADNPIEIFHIRSGGMAIYGGVIGGLIAGGLYSKFARVSFGTLADLCAPALAIGQGIGRWGNFVNQEAYGRLIENPALHFFPAGVYIEALGEWHYATFFYESAWCIIIAASLLLLERKNVFKRRGDVFLWYVIAYAAERMVVEGMRTDSLYLGGIRISQLLSAGMIASGIIILLVRAFRSTGRISPVSSKKFAVAAAVSVLAIVCIPFSLKFLSPLFQAVHALILLFISALVYPHTTIEESSDSHA